MPLAQVSLASEAAVILGAHGADLANAFFAHSDAAVVEGYPIGTDGEKGMWKERGTFASQLERAGRRVVVARLFNVSVKAGADPLACNRDAAVSSDWMYRSECVLTMDLARLRDVLEVVRELVAPGTVAHVGPIGREASRDRPSGGRMHTSTSTVRRDGFTTGKTRRNPTMVRLAQATQKLRLLRTKQRLQQRPAAAAQTVASSRENPEKH